VVACGGSRALSGGSATPSSAASGPVGVPFTEVLATAMARHDSGPTVFVGATATSQATITRLLSVTPSSQDLVLVAAFQGEQRTGGFAIAITKIERDRDRLIVHATFVTPQAGSITTQVITSPAHVVSVRAVDVAGARVAVLLDQSGAQQAQTNIT